MIRVAVLALSMLSIPIAAAETIRGTATYADRPSLPPTAVLEITLEDVPGGDVAPTVVASTRLTRLPGSPVPFALTYDPQRIIHTHRYEVRARILADGKPLLVGEPVAVVITYGSPTSVALTLQPIKTTPTAEPPEQSEPSPGGATKPASSSPLPGTEWQLVQFQSSNGSVVAPDDRLKYTLVFVDGVQVAVRLDCNRGRGSWRSGGPNQLRFGPLALTRASCPEGSLQNQIVQHWALIRSFAIKAGHLFLAVNGDGGTYEFEPFGTGRR